MSGDDHYFKSWYGHDGPTAASCEGFEVIDCQQCGFKHCVPIPTPEELEKAYAQDYYTHEKPLYIERYTEDLDLWNSVYERRYDFLASNLARGQRCGGHGAWLASLVLPTTKDATRPKALSNALMRYHVLMLNA